MSTRISETRAPLALATLVAGTAACGGGATAGDRIDCAVGGAAEMARDCVMERDGDRVTVRHPDGGFRQFQLLATGGIVAADGASPARLLRDGDGIADVAIEGDRYRIPALAKGR